MRFCPLLVVFALAGASGPTFAAEGAFRFETHWRRPVPLQGAAPQGWSDLEKSLQPADCGTCHEQRYDEWKTTRHAHAMGQGVTGQMREGWLDRGGQDSCLDCHAPLGEQRPWRRGENEEFRANTHYDKKLSHSGVLCAGCHVRKNRRYGPPPASGKGVDPDAPHGGFVVVKNFRSARLCKACHQFPPDWNRVEGKLLEDTYEQWRQSRFAKEGTECADCHMPEQKHLWRGIHDKKMTQSGVAIRSGVRGDTVTVTVRNNGTGHFFPTYVTPLVMVRLLDAADDSRVIDEAAIGWKVSVSLEEEFDTRIPPGESFEARFLFPPNVARGRVRITVYPDDFYRRFYESLLKSGTDAIDRKAFEKALDTARKSSFVIYDRVMTRTKE